MGLRGGSGWSFLVLTGQRLASATAFMRTDPEKPQPAAAGRVDECIGLLESTDAIVNQGN